MINNLILIKINIYRHILMVKTATSKRRDVSSTPEEGTFKFSHSIYLKTEKIIKFAKALQDFIILQHKEILDYCAQEDTNEQTKIEEINEPVNDFVPPPKRKVGRPRRNTTSEGPLIKKTSKPTKLIRAGVDKEGKPLYKMAPYYTEVMPSETSPTSTKSIPQDLIKKLDEYILEEKPYQKSIEEEEENNDMVYYSS